MDGTCKLDVVDNAYHPRCRWLESESAARVICRTCLHAMVGLAIAVRNMR